MTPKNQQGQRPTKDPRETAERLDEKKRGVAGTANKERIEEQERTVESER